MTRKMTFTEFLKTRKVETKADYIARMGDTGEIYSDSVHALQTYGEGNPLWIAITPSGYWLQIGRDEWVSDDLLDLEAHLFAWAYNEGYCDVEVEQ